MWPDRTILNSQKCLKTAKIDQNWSLKKAQKRAKTGLGAQRAKKFGIWASQNFFQKCVRACPWPVRPIQKSPIFSLKKFEFPAFFFEKNFLKKIILKPIFNNEPMKFGKNLIYYTNILHEKWHILKENQNLSWDQNEQNNT